jgi:hypothetical protein
MPRPTRIIGSLRLSHGFDYNSIMIYGSTMGMSPGSKLYPLITRPGMQPIYMGGNPDPQLAGLSDLDIERIASLYPPFFANPQPIAGGPNGKRSANASALPAKQTLEVIVPGVFTTIVKPVPVPAPTDLPKLEKGSSVVKLPNPCGGECPGDMDVE